MTASDTKKDAIYSDHLIEEVRSSSYLNCPHLTMRI